MEFRKMKWLLYCVSILLFIFLFISEVGLINSVKRAIVSTSLHQLEKYAIVFDGGSTGTRIHVFKFSNSSDGSLVLQDEYFEEVKPGLSSYAEIPRNAALSIKTLLDKAKTLIPSDRWNDTPITLKATAGLRLLPMQQANSILDEVLDFVKNSPFHCAQTCVSVLDGEDEGIFAWFTINFLLGYLQSPKNSVAVLDLGGGSTQVTFAPSDPSTSVSSPHEFIVSRKVEGRTLTLYSHSYLGLGLMSARFSILKSTTEDHGSNDGQENVLRSPCMTHKTKVTWKHGLEQYTVKGMKSGEHSFEACYRKTIEFLNETVHRSAELRKKDVLAVSYYTERVADLGLVGPSGGLVTVEQIKEATKKECSRKTPTKPFLCLDATYIVALLRHGLGFSEHKEIHLIQQIKGIEASWGLGAAFSLF